MTSETEALKTNEFLRRRKLRIQQVREQSKEIAKKIRQRTNVEKLRTIGDLDAKKEKEYFQHQEKLVKKLELLYVNGLRNVGSGHRNASEVQLQENVPIKVDLSKRRAKEATAELRRKKQEKLDEQKKLLDRKLQARETANEISREKSSAVASKLLGKSSSKSTEVTDNKTENPSNSNEGNDNAEIGKQDALRTEMATQWDMEELPNEWEPHIPELSLPKDDRENLKESSIRNVDIRSDKNRRLNLFAVSDEMPSSLRGGLTSVPEENVPPKPSLTLVSEYLQNRGLRLRESDPPISNQQTTTNKKYDDDLQSIKQTILRTRSSKPEGSEYQNVCHVADIQVVPVPSWQAGTNCGFCPRHMQQKHSVKSREFKTVTNSQINKIFSSIRPVQHDFPNPSPVLRGSSPFRRNKLCHRSFATKRNNEEKFPKCSETGNAFIKKNSVTMYNHSTRDTRDVPCSDNKLVVRDPRTDEDAYSQAMRESSSDNTRDKEHQEKLQEMRNKIAMTKQNVEKEYKDTMAFLNSLPKDKSKPIKNAYMDEHRQQMQKESRQRKMQQEFKKIEKECRRQVPLNPKANTAAQTTGRTRSKTPEKVDFDDDFNSNDFQYSWMPVPESDGNLAIHTIPTTLKEGKSGNTVKFSKVDSYHEYRSRHKHTPPTKDIYTCDKNTNKRVMEAVVIEQNDEESTDCSSIISDTSSVENLQLEKDKKQSNTDSNEKLSDAERIIIYKILDSKIGKKNKDKKHAKILKDIAKSLSSIDKERNLQSINTDKERVEVVGKQITQNMKKSKHAETRISFEQLNEGLYKTVNEKGDNIATMYFSDSPREGDIVDKNESESDRQCPREKDCSQDVKTDAGMGANWESGDDPAESRSTNIGRNCTSRKKLNSSTLTTQPSEASFKTATNDKTNVLTDDGFLKLLENGGQDAGKFYIGASGFLKDDAYEVIIQLRKKDGAKEGSKETEKETEKQSINVTPTTLEINKNIKNQQNSSTENVDKPNNVNSENPEYLSSRNMASNNIQSRKLPKHEVLYDVNFTSDDQVDDHNVDRITSSSISSDNMVSDEPSRQTNHLADKNVETPFKLDYAVPSNVKKSDSNPRPAASTYTQTTLGTPSQKPVFVHMSSSTSTAYMSPPELILPKFLKQNYKISYDEICDLTQNSNLRDGIIEFVDEETVACTECAGCTCKRCTHARRVIISKTASKDRLRTSEHKVKTPPNTARNSASEEDQSDSYIAGQGSKNGICFRNRISKKVRNKCRRCEKHSGSKICLNNQHNKKRNVAANQRSSTNFMLRVNSNASSSCKYATRQNVQNKYKQHANLNPVVKSYVDKLLHLNREGIRAIEVMNQDCSSVTTPGSSIVDVARNIDTNKPTVENKISLEHIKDLLTKQVLENVEKIPSNPKICAKLNSIEECTKTTIQPRISARKKSLHKVKSLNISKRILKNKSGKSQAPVVHTAEKPVLSSTKEDSNKNCATNNLAKTKFRSTSSPSSPRNVHDILTNKTTTSNIVNTKKSVTMDKTCNSNANPESGCDTPKFFVYKQKSKKPRSKSTSKPHLSSPTESGSDRFYITREDSQLPLNMSTQTSRMIDNDIHFMKLAEDKLQNMEKIADLTEKCTKRLTNLAKVLEEVRKNKSLVYGQISDSASDSDHRSDILIAQKKTATTMYEHEIKTPALKPHENVPPSPPNARFETKSLSATSLTQQRSQNNIKPKVAAATPHFDLENIKQIVTQQRLDEVIAQNLSSNDQVLDQKTISETLITTEIAQSKAHTLSTNDFVLDIRATMPPAPVQPVVEKEDALDSIGYIPFLIDIPKPTAKTSTEPLDVQTTSQKFNIQSENKIIEENINMKYRARPPPALSRINLKDVEDHIIPHELSTVMEVDSPMSLKIKNQSARNDTKYDDSFKYNKEIKKNEDESTDQQINPDILLSNIKLTRRLTQASSTDSSDDSKLQIMDLKQFNEIMLKPFISLQDYAKQCNIELLDEGSNIDDIVRDGVINDDISSLQSDGSLPDVIAELLKRNIISEPFKFDTASNANSTSISSESTLSMLALSKRKDKRKPNISVQNKENIGETSDTLSISSNPDLENAFKKLGMGWASSTLKKTKERLALSSSSNTSGSSVSQFKLKIYKNQNAPVAVSDSVSSMLDTSKKPLKEKIVTDSPKNAEQQTSQMNSITVKEFLTNELAKKITFTNKSHRDDTDEFISLYETRMPDEMKHSSFMIREERCIDSGHNGSNNRARTSTPVQLFKSMTYHSSSSSNLSNGLFSNAEDLSSVKGTSNSLRNHSTSDKDDLTVPNYSLRMRKANMSDCSKSD